MMRALLALALLASLASGAAAQGMSVEDFESGLDGDWSLPFGFAEYIDTDGSNNFLRNPDIQNFAPIVRGGDNVPGWTGDFVAAQTFRISADFISFGGPSYIQYFPLTIVLRDTNGTPDFPDDDVFVYPDPYYWNSYAPDFTAGWQTTSFDIPWDFVGAGGETPAGWVGQTVYDTALPADVTFQDVLASVDRLEWWWFHPAEFGIYDWFDIGVDNIVLEWSGGPVRTSESSVSQMKSNFK